MAQSDKLTELLAPTVEGMDYEFVGLEYLSGANPALLRIYIDHPEGISVDDCALVSRQLSAVLDVEDPIAGEYNLEVSSPGLDRPLFTAMQFQAVAGQVVKAKLSFPFNGRRNFTGKLVQADDQMIELEIDNELVALSIADIEKANLVFEHGQNKKRRK